MEHPPGLSDAIARDILAYFMRARLEIDPETERRLQEWEKHMLYGHGAPEVEWEKPRKKRRRK